MAGCAPKPAPSITPEHQDPCRLAVDSTPRLDTLTVALLEPVNLAHVTAPANDSERLLFRNVFDNLVRLDCENVATPALAGSWVPDSTGRAWILTLRPDPRIAVAGRMLADQVAGIFNPPLLDSLTAKAVGVDSAVSLDDRRVRVALRRPVQDSAPRFLADPALALMDGYRFEAFGAAGSGERILEVAPERDRAAVVFLLPLLRDPRDALDAEVDLMVTRDPTLVDYISDRSEFVTLPLPWSRIYVLAEYRAGRPLAAGLGDPSTRRSLVSSAVRADARVAAPPDWWSEATACSPAFVPRLASPSRRLVYPEADTTARALAERMVALAPSSAGLRAAGLSTAEFSAAVREGTERAYVIGLPRHSLAPCRDAALWPAGAGLFPLIDTRAFAIVRRGAPPLSVDWDGTLRILEP